MSSFDAVVIGGGAVGLCSAIALASRGICVALVERGLFGGGNSTLTGGGVRAQFGSAVNVSLSQLSQPFWREFDARFGVDPLFTRIGYLFLTRAADRADVLAEQVVMQQGLGVPSVALEGEAIVSRWPQLATCGFVGGSFSAEDGWLEQHRVIDGLVRGALAAKVSLFAGTEVTGLVGEAGVVRGIETTAGRIDAAETIIATGPWLRRILGPDAVHIPVTARRHELLLVESDPARSRHLPWLIDIDNEVHLRPDTPGRALVGGFLGCDDVVNEETFDRRVDDAWSSRVRAAAERSFGGACRTGAVIRSWAGLYPSTPDHHPIVDRLRNGLSFVGGFSGTGLMHAPAAGTLIAELIVDGCVSSVDPAAVGIARFTDTGRDVERSGF